MMEIPHAADFNLAQDCLEGRESALREFHDTYRPIVMGYFRKYGISEEKANELTDALWLDLLGDASGRRPKLANYLGKAALSSWLWMLVTRAIFGGAIRDRRTGRR